MPESVNAAQAAARAQAVFLRACAWDVAVRKPGNVSRHSAGHRMQARMFLDSAQACAGPLCTPGATVGARIEGAVRATQAAVGCNTNLGIVLLCAPSALAFEALPADGQPATTTALRQAWRGLMGDLTVADAEHAYRAIALARPGGLGDAPQQDVREAPSLNLRAAMALAAGRDRIAAQYRDAGADLFEIGLTVLASRPGLTLLDADPFTVESPNKAHIAAVQHLYLAFLASAPDSHIVRKHGEALAHSVMKQAAPWLALAEQGEALDTQPGFAAWDETLKAQGINPGTSADLTVASLMLWGLHGGLPAQAWGPGKP
ncbi:MAG: triphosphoribosyl-dephospho-CoA synthase [Vitreoscilla sp.]|nr:triphosphoribosyl-dephospho-CoA synthase [Vitreoscilla sp.]MBP6675909.1 triphosphoribosyl-dephospho-CoA synthase [Vitreoscilla sp.]